MNLDLIELCGNENITKELLENMIKSEADINIQNKYGYTTLMYLCENKNVTKELLEIMIKNGANINIQDIYYEYTCINVFM